MKEPSFLTLAEVLEIHRDQIKRYGGGAGLRDIRLLEAAIAVPQASFEGKFLHSSLFKMAAAYAYHISENQPFVDGNKRTALAAALIFLKLNGVSANDPEGKLYDVMMKVANKQIDKEGLAKIFKNLGKG